MGTVNYVQTAATQAVPPAARPHFVYPSIFNK